MQRLMVLVIGLCAVLVFGCDDSYAYTDSASDSELDAEELDAEDQGWLDAHNDVRQLANNGAIPGQPQAVPAMDALTWDPLLAQVAQTYAETCVWAHNGSRGTQYEALGGSGSVGENLWMTSSTSWSFNPTGVIDSWYSEYALYTTWEPIDSTNYMDIGHYTQLVWRDTERVGCGYAQCPSGTIVACDYSPSGNYLGQHPY